MRKFPHARAHVFSDLDEQPNAVIAFLAGGSEGDSPNKKITDITRCLGKIAERVVEDADCSFALQSLAGFCIGWLVALDERRPNDLVDAERDRQESLFRAGKIMFTCSSPVADRFRKLRVLIEEIGEVADAIERFEKTNGYRQKEHLITEIVQVAAVAVAWLESMEAK